MDVTPSQPELRPRREWSLLPSGPTMVMALLPVKRGNSSASFHPRARPIDMGKEVISSRAGSRAHARSSGACPKSV
jgi:hypothetical protein